MKDLTSADLTFKGHASGGRTDYAGIYHNDHETLVGVEVTTWPIGFEPVETFYYTIDAKRTAKEAFDLSDSTPIYMFDEYDWEDEEDDNDWRAFFPTFRNWDNFLAHARTLLS